MHRHIVAILISLALVAITACDPQDGAKVRDPQKTATRQDPAAQAQDRAGLDVAAGGASPKIAGKFTDCLLACDAAKTNHTDKAACRSNCEAPGTAVSADTAPTVGSDPVGYFVTCVDRCHVDGKTSDDECTGSCKTAVASSPVAPKAAVFEELGTCLSTCRAAKHVNPTNHATCALECSQIARVAGPAAPVEVAAKAAR